MNHIGTRTLTTDRLTLRRFVPEDAESMFYHWASDPEVTRYLTWQSHPSVERTEALLRDWIGKYEDSDYYQWAIELNELEQPIGTISSVGQEEDIGAVEVGFCIGRKFWNQGYASEALREVIRFFLDEVGATRVWARHDTHNPSSGKAMAAAGMGYEGTLRKSLRNNQGIVDAAVYAKVAGDAALKEEEDVSEEAAAVVEKVMGEDGRLRNVVSDETIEYVGILAKLELSPEEAKVAKKDMEDMLDYIDELGELDTSGVEPMTHIFPIHNVFREDRENDTDGSRQRIPGTGSEAALSNAPDKKNGGFVVPKTIGD